MLTSQDFTLIGENVPNVMKNGRLIDYNALYAIMGQQ